MSVEGVHDMFEIKTYKKAKMTVSVGLRVLESVAPNAHNKGLF